MLTLYLKRINCAKQILLNCLHKAVYVYAITTIYNIMFPIFLYMDYLIFFSI